MQKDGQWVRAKLEEIKHKRDLLKKLQDKLGSWSGSDGLAELPEEKREALMALVEESQATLKSLIDRVGDDIQDGLDELKRSNG